MKKISINLIVPIVAFFLIPSKIIAQGGWISQNIPGQSTILKNVYVFDVNTAIAVGDSGTIIKTTNGGTNWVSQTSGTSNMINSVYFVDSNTGWIVGRGSTLLKTTNGGTNWVSQASQNYDPFYSVFFINLTTGWITGEDNTILKT